MKFYEYYSSNLFNFVPFSENFFLQQFPYILHVKILRIHTAFSTYLYHPFNKQLDGLTHAAYWSM